MSPDLAQIGGRALVEVLDTLLSLPVVEVAPKNESTPDETAPGILVTVKLTGERLSGGVHLQIPRDFADQAAGRLLGGIGGNFPSGTDVDDFTGELCNMIAGRVAGQLREDGHDCALGTPKVVRGSRFQLETEAGADYARSEWSCQGHSLALLIHCYYRPA